MSMMCGYWLHRTVNAFSIHSAVSNQIAIDSIVTALFAIGGLILGLWYSVTLLALGWARVFDNSTGFGGQEIAYWVARWGAPLVRRSAAVMLTAGLTFSGGSALADTPDLGWMPTSSSADGTPAAQGPAETESETDEADRAPSAPTPTISEVSRRLLETEHVVQPADSLWSIAHNALDPSIRTNETITQYWQQIYEANREVIGSSPDVILPGQLFIIEPFTSTTSEGKTS